MSPQDGKNKKIRTESGVWIPATFQKAGKYEEWKRKTQADAQDEGDDESAPARRGGRGVKGGWYSWWIWSGLMAGREKNGLDGG